MPNEAIEQARAQEKLTFEEHVRTLRFHEVGLVEMWRKHIDRLKERSVVFGNLESGMLNLQKLIRSAYDALFTQYQEGKPLRGEEREQSIGLSSVKSQYVVLETLLKMGVLSVGKETDERAIQQGTRVMRELLSDQHVHASGAARVEEAMRRKEASEDGWTMLDTHDLRG